MWHLCGGLGHRCSVLSDHSRVKFKTGNIKIAKKLPDAWKVNQSFPSNAGVKQEVMRKLDNILNWITEKKQYKICGTKLQQCLEDCNVFCVRLGRKQPWPDSLRQEPKKSKLMLREGNNKEHRSTEAEQD